MWRIFASRWWRRSTVALRRRRCRFTGSFQRRNHFGIVWVMMGDARSRFSFYVLIFDSIDVINETALSSQMQRSIPFYTERIVPEAVNKGQRVLITSHENAIRGILMHLCEIPEEAMNQLHLPNGLPLVSIYSPLSLFYCTSRICDSYTFWPYHLLIIQVYNVKRKCITLLDDGSGEDPMLVHDFGPAAQYLFRPCELDDDFFEEMEQRTDLETAASAPREVAAP